MSRRIRLTRAAGWVLASVAVQRMSEIVWAGRNERRLRRRGGVEHGSSHYPVMVVMHVGWFVATALESSSTRRTRPVLLTGYALLQPLRYWVIRSLGDRWTTRIFVVPGEEPVRHGPYRFLRHPNYAVVVAEIALLPAGLGAPRTAGCFTVLNALLMAVRIPAEERALADARPDQPPSSARGRFAGSDLVSELARERAADRRREDQA